MKFFGTCVGLLLAGSVLAAEPAALQPIQTPSMTSSLVRVMGALALVFAVFLGGLWLFRNWQRLTIQRGRPVKLSVIEVKPLGPKHALYVVGYEDQRFLLSSAPSGVNLLTALPAAADEPVEAPAAPATPNFLESFQKALALTKGS